MTNKKLTGRPRNKPVKKSMEFPTPKSITGLVTWLERSGYVCIWQCGNDVSCHCLRRNFKKTKIYDTSTEDWIASEVGDVTIPRINDAFINELLKSFRNYNGSEQGGPETIT